MTVAADTRISNGYNIVSRNHSKTTKLTNQCVITSAGMVADVMTLHKHLIFWVREYEMKFKRTPPLASIAKKLSVTLYSRRFMPFYAFNLLAGVDENGQGVVFGYDAVGSYGTETYGVQGSGSQLGVPVLDNQFVGHNFIVKTRPENIEEVQDICKDVVNSIAERDIYTGDQVEIITVDVNGVRDPILAPLRRD